MIALTKILVTLPPLLSILLKITIILGLGWTLHFLLARRNPRWRVLLWRAVVAGVVLVPILVPLKYLQVPVTPPPEPTVPFRTPVEEAEQPLVEISYSPTTEPVATLKPETQITSEPHFSISTWARQNPYPIIFFGWAFITVLITARFLTVLIKIQKRVKSSLPAPIRLQHLLDEVADDLNCSQKIDLRYSSRFTSPFLTGLTSPIIILPKNIIASKYTDELPAIFAHEVAHLRSWDLLWMFATRWLSTALWFHPLVWKLRDAHNAACEEVCDAVAADYVGNAESYSSTLARIALEIGGTIPAIGGIPMARSSQIIGRLRILKQRIYSLPLARHWVALSLLAVSICLIGFAGLTLVHAQNPTVTEPNTRVIHFPKDQSLGLLYIRDEGVEGLEGWEELGSAQGELSVPKDKVLKLCITDESSGNLPRLSDIGPHDLQALSMRSENLRDADLQHLKGLIGLQSLTLIGPVTGEGFAYLKEMKSLRELALFRTQIDDESLGHLKTLASLEKMYLWNNDHISGAGFAQLENLKWLRLISFYQVPINDEAMKHLAEIRSLEELHLQSTKVTDKGLRYLKRLSKLKALVLPPGTTDQGLADLKTADSLEKINLPNTAITDDGLVHLKDMKSLKSLLISSSLMTGESLAQLREMPLLTDLTVSLTNIDETGLANLEGLPVRSLNLSGTVITDAGLIHVAELKSLQKLFLDRTNITNAGIVHLSGSTSLKYLSLNNTQISDEGLSHLRNLQSLETLNLRRTKISDAGLDYLKGLRALRQLDLKGTKVTAGGAEAIREALPHCRLVGVEKSLKEPVAADLGREKSLIGERAPELAIEKLLQAPEGAVANWQKLKGNVVVIDFWATWCGPCVKAFPHINSLAEKFKDRPVRFISVTDESEDVVRDFLKRYLLRTWVALDIDKSVFKAFKIGGRPVTVVVSKEGIVVDVVRATDLTERTLSKLLTGQNLSPGRGMRVIQFPNDRSMGLVYVGELRTTDPLWWQGWEEIGEAKGDVAVPANKDVRLSVNANGLENLSFLEALGPDDIQALDFVYPLKRLDDKALVHLAQLTGLRLLRLTGASIHGEGLRHLTKLKRLESLGLQSTEIADEALKHVGRIGSLLYLSLGMTPVTDKGLAHLRNLSSLRTITLEQTSITGTGFSHLAGLESLTYAHLCDSGLTDEGLREVAKLKSLEILRLEGTKITGRGIGHLEHLRRLRELNLGGDITDASLEQIGKITSLEKLELPRGTTTAGLGKLTPLTTLKHLGVVGMQYTDDGLGPLRQFKNLQYLALMRGITDEDLAAISTLTSLEELIMNSSPITNKGLAQLAALKSLKRLTLHHGHKSVDMDITVSGVRALKGLPLKYLQLGNIKLDDFRLTALANFPGLEELHMCPMPVRDEDLAIVGKLSQLKRLLFVTDTVSDGGLEYLVGLNRLEDFQPITPLTDKGLFHIGKMRMKGRLVVKGHFTDEGLRYLEGLSSLRQLIVTTSGEITDGAQKRLKSKLPNLSYYNVQKSREARQRPKVGEAAPPFALKPLDDDSDSGEEIRLEGKAVLLYFWATWCAPCKASTPGLKQLYAELKKRHGDRFVMLGLSLDSDETSVRRYVEKEGIPWPQVCIGRNSQTAADYGVYGVPMYYVIGPDGTIAFSDHDNGGTIEAAVDTALSKK